MEAKDSLPDPFWFLVVCAFEDGESINFTAKVWNLASSGDVFFELRSLVFPLIKRRLKDVNVSRLLRRHAATLFMYFEAIGLDARYACQPSTRQIAVSMKADQVERLDSALVRDEISIPGGGLIAEVYFPV